MTPIKLISFDIWDTLIKSNPENKKARAKILSDKLGIEEEKILAVSAEVSKALDNVTEITGEECSVSDRIAKVMEKLLNSPVTEEKLQEIKECFDTTFLSFTPILMEEDVIDVITELKNRGYKIAFMSNSGFIDGTVMRQALVKTGLMDVVDYTVFSNEVGKGKPAPEIFDALLLLSGMKREEILHVGNSFLADYKGALTNGLQALWYDKKNSNTDASVASITTFKELLTLTHE